jgi:hypothetical protein
MRVRQHPVDLKLPGKFFALVFASILFACSQPTVAHHSFPPLLTEDGKEVIRIFEGSIELFKLLNPHTALIVNITNENDVDERWLIEFSASFSLVREGWTNDTLSSGDKITIAILASNSPNRGRLRAVLVHEEPSRLLVAYGIRGDTPIMRRLRARLPTCETIEGRLDRTECFSVDAQALHALEQEFPGQMGYVMP